MPTGRLRGWKGPFLMFGLVGLADDRREILGMFSDKKYNADFATQGCL
jgi:hypothetical protein